MSPRWAGRERVLGAAGTVLRSRVRQGWARVRRAVVPVLLASLAAGIAYGVARYGLGHPAPFFAPVSAWVALGFSADRQPRRVAELAIGVALGVLAGDLLVHVIGTGAVQVAVVLAVAALTARFIDRGDLLTTQAGVQAIVIVALPAAQSGGPVDRWTDALVGGAVALVVAALSPQDPRRRVRSLAEEGLTEIAEVLGHLARGLGGRRSQDVEEALVRGRASQPVLDQWRSAAASARQGARVSPAFRRHGPELAALEAAAVLADRAMRNTRVLVRRALLVVGGDDQHDLAALATLVDGVRAGTEELAVALAAGAVPARARERLAAAAEDADPWTVAPDDWHVQGLVLLLRSLVVDLEEAAGMEPTDARAHLPEM
ncbi:MAG TPA: FUSC family protein [Actinotalea sp.]|nr:FUSC family protein [Actinotalea sp.]